MNIWRQLNRRVHVSWQVTTLFGGILVGIGLSLLPEAAIFASWWWLVLAGGGMVLVCLKSKVWMLILALVAGMLVGLWRGTVERVELGAYSGLIGMNVELMGVVFEDPSVELGSQVRLRLVDSQVGERQLPGQVWVSVIGRTAEIKRSDVVVVSGKLKSGFGTFPASISYGKLVGVESRAGADPAREMRDEFGEKLENAIDQPAENLGMGILAGQKTALPSDVAEAFRIAGLTHIVVASGYNLTILIRFARRLFAKISRLAALFGAGGLMLSFAFVTGFSPSMTRAAMVAGLSLLAWFYGRKFHPVVLILSVAALTAIVNPYYVWGDAGWYMSFSAFAGVIMVAPLIQDYFFGKKAVDDDPQTLMPKGLMPKGPTLRQGFIKRAKGVFVDLRQVFIETTSAQLVVAPVIAIFLGQFAPYGLVANLLVLPIVPLTMLLTFVAGVVSWFAPAIGAVVAWPAQKLLDYIIWVSEQVARLPGAAQAVQLGIFGFLTAITLIIISMVYMQRRTKHSFREDNIVE
jgi:competence protein ComEC